jgi:hypothetical protein
MKKPIHFIFVLIIGIIMLATPIVYAKTPPPLNDECSGAIFITPTAGNLYSIYNNINATVSAGVPTPSCATPMSGDVWFAVIVPMSGHLIFDTKADSIKDGGMAIYSGSCGSLLLIACNDNKSLSANAPDSMPQIEKYGLLVNDTIYIRFWGKGVNKFGTFKLSVIAAPLQPPCSNLGFENGFNGWFTTLGQQYEGAVGAITPVYYPLSFNNTADANFELVTSGNDSYGGFSKVYSGAKSVRIGEIMISQTYDAASVEQTFTVGPLNSLFVYHYAVVLQNGTHPYYEQPFFKVELFDPNGNLNVCGSKTFVLPDSTFIQTATSNTFYKPWTTVKLDLSAYSGQNVTVRFTISDCTPTGHWGYAYIDCECQPYQINSSRDTVCAGDYVTLTAPAGAYSYLWMPGGYTTQSIVVTPIVATTYYCTHANSATDVCPGTFSKTIYITQGLAIPTAAGNISSNGNSNVSQGQNHVLYVVPPINNAISYTWYYSGSGVTFFPSNKTTTDSVWLNFSSTATSGNLTVVGHNNCSGDGLFSANYPITVGPAGINENNGSAFVLYPNPNKGIFNIVFENIREETEIAVYNLQGNLIYDEWLSVSEQKTAKEINLTAFATGIYAVKIKSSGFVRTEKLVIQ